MNKTLMVACFTFGAAIVGGAGMSDAVRSADPGVEAVFNRQWAEQVFAVKPGVIRLANRFTIVHEDGPGETKVGKCCVGTPIRLGNKVYTRGIGTNSYSVLRVTLAKPAARFLADIGMDRNVDNSVASSAFHVSVDGKDLFTSKVMRGNGEAQSIDVPLNGAKSFDLILDKGGDERTCDQGDWADARVILQDGSQLWIDELAAQGEVAADLPFSFVYGGRHSSEFIHTWKSEVKDEQIDSTKRHRTLTFTDPDTGLQVRAEVTVYLDTVGVDWTLYFTNTGTNDTPLIEQVKAVDIAVKPAVGEQPVLHRLHGSTGCTAFTFDDYQPYDEAVSSGKKIDFGAEGAMSSYDVCPFFNLDWGGGGVITAVGWTGHWGAAVERVADGPLKLHAAMRTLHLRLHPGETIRSPRILQVYWFGREQVRGYNLFRQTMLNHIVPKVDGQTVAPPIAHMTSSFWEYNSTTEKTELGWIESFKDLGFECYWLDAWWHKDGFPAGIGNYGFPIERVPDPVRFPNGLKPVGDAAHKAGMKFLVWFAPESVSLNSALSKEHPEWVLSPGNDGSGTFDLAIPEAREFMTRYLNTAISAYGIDCFRTDSGPSLDHWKLADKDPDRVGITEIRHVEGYYRMWDDIRKANPHLFIDNCCGGGTRIDLETCSRSLPLWRTDCACWTLPARDLDKAAIQNQAISMGLNRYVPLSTEGTMGCSPYYWRSGFNGGIAFDDDTRVAGYPKDQLAQAIAEGKRIRKYYFGNLYPLSAQSTAAADWAVVQYHRPAEQDGMVLAFRRHESPYASFMSTLREIEPSAEYRVTKYISYRPSRSRTMKGSQLQQLKLEIDDCPGSVLIEYRKL